MSVVLQGAVRASVPEGPRVGRRTTEAGGGGGGGEDDGGGATSIGGRKPAIHDARGRPEGGSRAQ